MTEINLSLRRAGAEDCDLIRSLADKAFPATYRDLITPRQMSYMMELMYAPDVIRGEINRGCAWFIAFAGDEPCGYLSIERQDNDCEDRKSGHASQDGTVQECGSLFLLNKIYVLPGFQGIGAGEYLFRHAVEYIRSAHPAPCRMELHVNRGNSAVRFYERMGMRKLREGDFEIGEGFYMNDYIMGLEIE